MKRLAIASAITLFAFSAYAQDASNAGGDPEGQWRLGAAAAFSDYDGDTTGVDDSTVGFKFSAQYQFNSWFGVEGAYLNTTDFSNEAIGTSTTDTDVSFSGLSISTVWYAPLPGDEFDVYALVGYFDFDADLSENGFISASGSTDGALLGAGATLKISDNFGVKAEFDWYDVDEADLWSMVLGLEYRF